MAVAEAGSFTRAAARLRVAQQALSQQIADLERELQLRLFERTVRGVRPTAGGAAFIEGARETLAQSERAVARARSRANSDAGRLKLAIVASYRRFEAVAAEAVVRFHRQHPGAQLEVLPAAGPAQLAGVREGALDLVIAHAPPPEDGDLAGEVLWEEPAAAVVLPADHPLARKDPLWLRDLADLPMLAFPRDLDPSMLGRTLGPLAERGLVPHLAPIRLAGPPALVGACVAAGWGWRLVIGAAEEEFEGTPGVAFRRLGDPPIPLRLWVLWRRDNSSALVGGFVEVCRTLPARPEWRSGRASREGPVGPPAARLTAAHSEG